MFTGIVEEVGRILAIDRSGDNYRLKIGCRKVLEGTKIGDSIATNGVCLTVVDLGEDYFKADLMRESMRRSSLGSLGENSRLNLERALSLNSRLGGHLVSGHIDGMGRIIRIDREKNAHWYSIGAGPEILRYVVEKGSIAIDGISLTVAQVDEKLFKVSVIPHTSSVTNLEDKKSGDLVNLEVDLLGKYVEKLLLNKEEKDKEDISLDLLGQYGFL